MFTSTGGRRPIMVVKLGSSSVTRRTGPDPHLLAQTLDGVVAAHKQGWDIVLVSSGSVSSGSAFLAHRGQTRFSSRLAAAVGQPLLMDIYHAGLQDHEQALAQILVSESDLASQEQMDVVAQITLECFERAVVPIVNGNDAIDRVGSDNDMVAAGIAIHLRAERLLLLTDVDGVYRLEDGARHYFDVLSAQELREISTASSPGTGRGGMRSKLRAAQLASLNGVEALIGNARSATIISDVAEGRSVGTRVPVASEAFAGLQKRWVGGAARTSGRIVVNKLAEESITKPEGSSLFASGVLRVQGSFAAGAVVEVASPKGRLIGRGTANASSDLMAVLRNLGLGAIGETISEILRKFMMQRGIELPPQATADEPSHPRRKSHQRAITQIGESTPAQITALGTEVLRLMATVPLNALADEGLADNRVLLDYYREAAKRIRFIDRQHLVVFRL